MGVDWFVWALLAALTWGLQPIFDKFGVTNFNSAYAALAVRCFGGLVGLLILPFVWPSITHNNPPITWKAPVSLIIAGFCGSVLGQIFYLNALKSGEVSKVPAVTAVWPLVSFILAVIFYKEAITFKKIIAFIMIIGGAILLKF